MSFKSLISWLFSSFKFLSDMPSKKPEWLTVSFKDWVFFFIITSFVFFICCDDEPLLEFSDWSIFHIVCVIISTFSVFGENIYKTEFGYHTTKDDTLLKTTSTYSTNIFLYFLCIVLVVFMHMLQPLDSNLFDNVETLSCHLIEGESGYVFCLNLTLVVYGLLSYVLAMSSFISSFYLVTFFITTFCIFLFIVFSFSGLIMIHGLSSFLDWNFVYNVMTEPSGSHVHFQPTAEDIFSWTIMHNRGSESSFTNVCFFLISLLLLVPSLYILFSWFSCMVSILKLYNTSNLQVRVHGFITSSLAYILSLLPFVLIPLISLALFNDLTLLRLGFRVIFELWFVFLWVNIVLHNH